MFSMGVGTMYGRSDKMLEENVTLEIEVPVRDGGFKETA